MGRVLYEGPEGEEMENRSATLLGKKRHRRQVFHITAAAAISAAAFSIFTSTSSFVSKRETL